MQPQSSGSNPLSGILGSVLNILPFIVPEIGIPARMALGGVASAASNAIQGKSQNLGQDLQTGISDGLMGGMMGAGGKAAADVADTAASDLADSGATDAATTSPTEPRFTVDPQGNVTSADNPGIAPMNLDPESGQGHVNLITNPETGTVKADTNNTFTPPATPAETPSGTQLNLAPTPEEPVTITPRTGADATSRYTPQAANTTPQLSPLQQRIRNEGLAGMTTTMQGAGMKLPAGDMNNLANQALDLGYSDNYRRD